jgi:hypothetical protein
MGASSVSDKEEAGFAAQQYAANKALRVILSGKITRAGRAA